MPAEGRRQIVASATVTSDTTAKVTRRARGTPELTGRPPGSLGRRRPRSAAAVGSRRGALRDSERIPSRSDLIVHALDAKPHLESIDGMGEPAEVDLAVAMGPGKRPRIPAWIARTGTPPPRPAFQARESRLFPGCHRARRPRQTCIRTSLERASRPRRPSGTSRRRETRRAACRGRFLPDSWAGETRTRPRRSVGPATR